MIISIKVSVDMQKLELTEHITLHANLSLSGASHINISPQFSNDSSALPTVIVLFQGKVPRSFY